MGSPVIAFAAAAVFIWVAAAGYADAVGITIFGPGLTLFAKVRTTIIFALICDYVTAFTARRIATSFSRIFAAVRIIAIEYAFTAFRAVTTAAAMWPAAATAAGK
jgi:hypothetical protein